MLHPLRRLFACFVLMWMAVAGAHAADDYLPPEQAFKFSARMQDGSHVAVTWDIADGYYMYRERFKFSAEGATTGAPAYPAGKVKFDDTFQKNVETYRHSVTIIVPVNAPGLFTLNAQSQGCADAGLCYAPQDATARLMGNSTAAPALSGMPGASTAAPAVKLAPAPAPVAAAPVKPAPVSELGSLALLLGGGKLKLIVPAFFLLGLGLSFTPCVLPMMPILSSIIVGEGAKVTRQRGLLLSSAYSLGMALVYTALGIAAGLAGQGLAADLQKPWVLVPVGLLMVGMSLSMFGFYELQLPSSLQSRLAGASGKQRAGKLGGVFVMGAISALIVSPCVAAPLAGALIYLSQSQNVVLGGTALFALSLGMGVPLLLIGASTGKLLPKTGDWMNTVRNFFGVLMLAMSVWLISPVIPASVQLALWAALLIVTAVYLNALDSLPAHANGFAKFWKGIAVMLLIFGITLLIGALSGAKSALQPFNGITSSLAANTKSAIQLQASSSLAFTRIASIAELKKKLAETNGKPVMLDFYADWCVACKELEQLTFSDAKVQQLLKNTTLLQVDVTANSDEDKALLKRFALFGPPGIVFFDGNGKAITSIKTVGFQNAERFTSTLAKRDSCIALSSKNGASTVQC